MNISTKHSVPLNGPALRIVNLHKSFGSTVAVNKLSFNIEAGEIFALLGPNGAGKSTTINMITGLTRLGGGHIEVFGHDVVKDYLITRRLVGVMHQEVILDNFLTVHQTLKIHSGYYGYKDSPSWRHELIERLALEPFLEKKSVQLSGGTKRRLMLAKALIHKPKLLILDEPTAGVDVELRHGIWNLVKDMQRQGTTVILTTHYLEEAEQMCMRVAIMNKGELVALSKVEDLLNKFEKKEVVVIKRASLEEIFLKLTRDEKHV